MIAKDPQADDTGHEPGCDLRARRKPGHALRCGAAAVEFAVVAPLLFSVVLAIMEFGRGIMVAETLSAAARAGSRAASLSGATTASATTIVTSNLTGITGTTVTMTVNGATKNASQSVSGDTVALAVSVPYSSVSWLP